MWTEQISILEFVTMNNDDQKIFTTHYEIIFYLKKILSHKRFIFLIMADLVQKKSRIKLTFRHRFFFRVWNFFSETQNNLMELD